MADMPLTTELQTLSKGVERRQVAWATRGDPVGKAGGRKEGKEKKRGGGGEEGEGGKEKC